MKPLETRKGEPRKVRPVTELRGVTSDADPLGDRRGRTIQDEQHVPSWRRNTGVGGRDNAASVATAGEGREDCACSESVSVGTRSSYKVQHVNL